MRPLHSSCLAEHMARVYSKAYRSDEPAMTSLARVYAGGSRRRRRCCSAASGEPPPTSCSVGSHAPTLISVVAPGCFLADVNVSNPKEYWDYENLAINWG